LAMVFMTLDQSFTERMFRNLKRLGSQIDPAIIEYRVEVGLGP